MDELRAVPRVHIPKVRNRGWGRDLTPEQREDALERLAPRAQPEVDMKPRFHAQDGFCFERTEDGSVAMYFAPDASEVGTTFSPETWASIVAFVSAKGENGATFKIASRFHAGDVVPAALQHEGIDPLP